MKIIGSLVDQKLCRNNELGLVETWSVKKIDIANENVVTTL